MAVRKFKPVTPGTRHKIIGTFDEITTNVPEKSLVSVKKSSGGRNNTGKMTVRYIGGQNGTTGQFYGEGSDDFGFDKLNATWKGYANGSLAVQDLINGGVNYVIIDAAPAAAIANSINAVA